MVTDKIIGNQQLAGILRLDQEASAMSRIGKAAGSRKAVERGGLEMRLPPSRPVPLCTMKYYFLRASCDYGAR
jgi:hypothetical protein